MTPIETVDTVVIGAGVIGLAVARALAMQGREVLIVEAADAIGTEVSARNSEVLHAGLYYPTGSAKARWCVEGRAALVDYCRTRGVAHQLCGKLVVATEPGEVPAIERLWRQAQSNGVPDVAWLTGSQAQALEPALRAVAAVHSPHTGIVDSHALMLALLADAEAAGAVLALRSAVVGGAVLAGTRKGQGGGTARPRLALDVVAQTEGSALVRLRAHQVVNAAGLTAPAVAHRVLGAHPAAAAIPQASFCKGHYFSLQRASPFRRLVYPVHTVAGLGTHLTLDLQGRARFGPDVQWVPAPPGSTHGDGLPTPEALGLDYAVPADRAAAFAADIRRYWPAVQEEDLQPDYAGVRPKIVGPGQPAADFQLWGPADHGIPGWVCLFGMESPGLTSCLSVGNAVVQALEPRAL